MTPLILRLDISGLPVTWMPWQEAISLYCRDLVGWTAGAETFTFYGGVNKRSGLRSSVSINSIIAVKRSSGHKRASRATPPLTNRELFLRDAHICMYCGSRHKESALTRDHVLPMSRGGGDRWSNVVTACRSCNARKGNRNPEEAGMPLLAVPYVPNWAEYLALSNRKILVDQMAFLKSQFSGRPLLFHDPQRR